MKTEKQQLGIWGEDLVASYYKEHGYRIIARNVRHGRGELDLICSKDSILYSVEIKTRRSLVFGYPEESINSRKRARLMRLTAEFLERQKQVYKAIRVQVCAVVITDVKVILKIYTVS
jgi:putative endonuclease